MWVVVCVIGLFGLFVCCPLPIPFRSRKIASAGYAPTRVLVLVVLVLPDPCEAGRVGSAYNLANAVVSRLCRVSRVSRLASRSNPDSLQCGTTWPPPSCPFSRPRRPWKARSRALWPNVSKNSKRKERKKKKKQGPNSPSYAVPRSRSRSSQAPKDVWRPVTP